MKNQQKFYNIIIYGGIAICVAIVLSIFIMYLVSRQNNYTKIYKYDKLVIAIPTNSDIPANIDEVEEKINEIVRSSIGVEVELLIVPIDKYVREMQTNLAGKNTIDVLYAPEELVLSATDSKQFLNLLPYAQAYMNDIFSVLGEDVINSCVYNNRLDFLPTMRCYADTKKSFVVRKDILDKYEIDSKTIDTIEKLESVFEIIKQNEIGMTVLASGNQSIVDSIMQNDKLGGNIFGVLKEESIINIFNTPEYEEALYIARKWYQKGYLSNEVALSNEYFQKIFTDNTIFAYMCDTNITTQMIDEIYTQKNLSILNFGNEMIYSDAYLKHTWAIAEKTDNPDKSVELLNLLYTNNQISNLLCYGIENKDYKTLDDGKIDYTSNVDRYNMHNIEYIPNMFLLKIWNGFDSDLWERCKQINETATRSSGLGFFTLCTNLGIDFNKMNSVYTSFKVSLENGLVEPQTALEQMIEQIDKIGIVQFVDRKISKYNKWLEVNTTE